MGWRTKLKGGDEWDMLTGWRRVAPSKQSAKVKRKHNKRARKEAKERLRET